MMEMCTVVKGIEHFCRNVLQRALSPDYWNEEDLTNAFQWAKFCEKVYEFFKTKAVRNVLDGMIHTRARKFPLAYQVRCFEDLKYSSSLLYTNLKQNPSICQQKIRLIYLDVLRKQTIDLEEMKYQEAINSLSYELIEAIKPIELCRSNRSLYKETKTEIYLNVLKDSITHAYSEREAKDFLTGAVEQLYEKEMDLLTNILAYNLKKEDKSSLAEIQEFAINWTVSKLMSEENKDFCDFLWKQHITCLRSIAVNCQYILHLYLNHLKKSSESLICEEVNNEMKWISRNPYSSWSFDKILSHFRNLLKDDDDVCEFTKKYLLDLLDTEEDVPIFKEIFCCVT